tara:strand:- start:123 stop:890 length:768 start_codon:yes stop_codon:yes gene_type:complete
MSVLFDAADKHANKRKNKLLDDTSTTRALFSSDTKSPLIPLHNHATATPMTNSLSESYAHLDLSGRHVDMVWAISCVALVFPVVMDTIRHHSLGALDIPYRCDYLYGSLFLSLPGLSVHLFCLFLLMSNRCRVGFACYVAGVALFVLSVELYCFYRVQEWCAVLFFCSIVAGVSGQALLVRMITGQAHMVVHAWHATAVGLAGMSLVQMISTKPDDKDGNEFGIVLMGASCVLWALSSWLTLLPVRIAYVQLYKS